MLNTEELSFRFPFALKADALVSPVCAPAAFVKKNPQKTPSLTLSCAKMAVFDNAARVRLREGCAVLRSGAFFTSMYGKKGKEMKMTGYMLEEDNLHELVLVICNMNM